MTTTLPKYKPLIILAALGLCVAVLSALENHLPWLAAFCGSFGDGCRETATFNLFRLPVSYWGIAYYVFLALAIRYAKPWVFWIVMSGFGVELTFLWLMITLKMVCVFCLANLIVFILLFFLAFDRGRIWQTVSMSLLCFILSGALLAWENPTESKTEPGQTADTIVASVAGTVITLEELEGPLASRIFRMQEEIHGLKRQRLDDLVTKHLLEKEAADRGVSLTSLLDSIFPDGIEVTDEEVSRYHDQNRKRLAGLKGSEESIRKKIKTFLEDKKRKRLIGDHVAPLKEKYEVAIFLKPPPLPFTRISEGNSPTWGPSDAPVTVIEFSDYLCPACRAAHDTTRKIRERYQGKIKWLFKDFPLDRHKGAKKLAEAARCAGEQDSFWAYQDLLFAAKDPIDSERLKSFAKKLNLEAERFARCLESGKYLAGIEEDITGAKAAGVGATPTFIINGRLMSGAPPFEKFQEMIEAALEKTK